MRNKVLIAIIFKFIHKDWSKSFTLILMTNSKECNLVKRLILKSSKCDTTNDFVIRFDDNILMNSIKKEFDDVFLGHSGKLFWVETFKWC